MRSEDRSGRPLTRAGLKWRWKASVTFRVASSSVAGFLNRVAIIREEVLEAPEFIGCQRCCIGCRRRDPVADAVAVKERPVELLARIDLAAGGDVRMGEHMGWRNGVAREDVGAEGDDRLHLAVRKGAVAQIVPGILDLDADRARVGVGLALP